MAARDLFDGLADDAREAVDFVVGDEERWRDADSVQIDARIEAAREHGVVQP
jgi:hypothetical protein